MEQKVRIRRKLLAEINVVPYIDVMLVLLVVFMVTAPMMTQGIKVALPEADSKPITVKDEEPLIVSIKKDGGYYVNLGKSPEKSVSLHAIIEKITRLIRMQPARMVLVEGDQSVAYGTVIELMAALQVAGVSNVGLITDSVQPRKL